MWSFISYNLVLRDHFVFSGLEEFVKKDLLTRYDLEPIRTNKNDLIVLDPGGLICTNTEALKSDLLTIKPEHILAIIEQWSRFKYLPEKFNNEKIIKVYYGDRYAAIMPESIYFKIGSWLALNKTNGYLATMEIAEKLNGSKNHLIFYPPVEGDS